MRAPFTVLEPSGAETPVIVEVPHAGTEVDEPAASSLAIPERCLRVDADLYVDELYADAGLEGAALLVAHASRYVVDLNRAETDVDAGSVEGAAGPPRAPRGVVWRLSSDGRAALRAPLTRGELERRLAAYYRPYHAALEALVQARLARHGVAVILAAHSMPSVGAPAGGGAPRARADVVPGTRGGTSCAPALRALVERRATEAGLSVAHDDPYRGGFTTGHYGRPRERRHVVQIELARRLYMDEATLERTPRLAATRAFCRGLVAALGAAARAL